MARLGRPPTCDCGECRRCKRAAYMREWYRGQSKEKRQAMVQARDRDRVRASDVRRYQDPKRKADVAKRAAAWRKRYPEKAKAQAAVSNAVRDGRLAREPCEVCGREDSHGHHDDYSKPLDVRWLCPVHHAEHHHRGASA